MKMAIIVYLVVSFFIGVGKIIVNDSIYRGVSDVPIGDMEFYDVSGLWFSVIHFIFFSSILVYYIWVGIIEIVAFIRERF